MRKAFAALALAMSVAACQSVNVIGTMGADGVTLSGIRLPNLKQATAQANEYCARYGKAAKAQNHYAMSIDGIVTYKCV